MARKAKTKKQAERATAARHRQFALEYIADYNGTRAYKAVYGEDMADPVAGAAASRLLKDVRVRSLLDELEAEALEAIRLNSYRILREQARVAFSDPANMFDKDGRLKPFSQMDADTRAAIASVEVFEEFQGKGEAREFVGFTKKVKLWDKNAAGANLMKHGGLFKVDNAQRGDVVREFMEAVSGHSRGLPGRHK